MKHKLKTLVDDNRAVTLCGKTVRADDAIKPLTQVECEACRVAFARILSALPSKFTWEKL